jgi:hypothetical protein
MKDGVLMIIHICVRVSIITLKSKETDKEQYVS